MTSSDVTRSRTSWAESPRVVLVAHDGGPRSGDIAFVSVPGAQDHLVYDGPRWLGVYRRSDPVRTTPTAHGDAEIWSVWG